MNYKGLALLLVTLTFAFETLMLWLEIRSAGRKIPDNVSDVYDHDAYQAWLSYHSEKTRLSLVKHIVSFLVVVTVIASDLYARLTSALGWTGYYAPALAVLVTETIISTALDLPFSYINTMRIEQKYGFNKTTLKTFGLDIVKSTLIELVVICALCCLFIWLHTTLGNWLLPVFAAILFVLVLLISTLYPFFSRVFNKFQPLEEGELRDRLLRLMTDNDCTVKEIKVMDASRRSTKANAYFSGMGKTKTIVLYDTLLEQMSADEIVAVFAHEVGHNKRKHTLKMQAMSALNIIVIVLLAWALVSFPAIYRDFGFAGINYGFAFYLLSTVCLSFISPALGLWANTLSRRYEYQADRFAAESGHGPALISALKKLTRNSFANLSPDPLLVKLSYIHPSTSQRIEALDKATR